VLAFVSEIMTLFPGDLIALGTPAGVGPLRPGDRVSVHLSGVGTLENPVEALPPPQED
jgi:2-keto-4-pentenoate hydratase/2-oxohepta-3-ene-1,7-dioic acid hydratase in catechol pathway